MSGKLDDVDTALYLEVFKEKYFGPIEKAHKRYMTFKELPEKEQIKADDVAEKYSFLYGFISSIESTLEQNVVLKNKVQN